MSDTKFKIPKSLIDALKAGEVVPFVGAGVSMTVKKKNGDGTESSESLFPSWKGFVEILAEALRGEHKPKEADFVLSSINIKKPKYLEAMQHAKEELGEGDWYRIFSESFDKSKVEAHEDSLKLAELVWKLSKNLVVTTNVDRVLEWTSPNPSETKVLDVQNIEYAQLQRKKIPARPTVWHLHGSVDHQEKVVFTVDQYKAFYEERNNEAKLQTLISQLTQHTFLFIGFSLDDAYIREQLEYIHKIYQGGADSFYILLRESEIEKANLPNYVKPIPFSEFGKPLEDLVEDLARIAKDGNNGGKVNPTGDMTNPPPKSDSDTKKPFFNVQYNSKGKEFVGRVGKIEEIWNLLNQEGCASIGQAVSVRGLGGFGKTQLAVEYAHAKKGEYKNGVFWVVADESIDNQLLQIADRQGWINQYDKTVNQLDVAKAKFLQLSDCLILFDNVETYAGIKDYLPKLNSQTHILITTREPQPAFKQIDLDLLERSESRELLLKISNRTPQDETEQEHLEKILETLGDIPLAIELVGGYLAEHENVSFEKYHQYLNDVPLNKLEKEFPEGSFTEHDRSIIKTLRISEKTIKEKPLMVEILKVLAWSGSSSMGTSLLKTLVEAETDFEFDTALGDAYKLRLLKKDEKDKRYAIHRLLAKVIRYEQSLVSDVEWQKKTVRNLEKWFGSKTNNFQNLAEFESEIEHLEIWHEQTVELLPAEAIILSKLRANIPYQRGNYQTAFDWFQKAFILFESEQPDNKELLANLLNDLGVIYGELGNHQQALQYKEKALELYKELFGENHPLTANAYNNLGGAYKDLGNYQEALKYVVKALETYKELFGEKHSDTATSYNNVGYTYGELGNHQQALQYLKKALELYKELFGENHPLTATSYNNVGSTYGELGSHQQALQYQEKALELREELFGENHPLLATSYNNVGSTYGELGNHQQALQYKEKALELYKELFGENHPLTANAYNNVGSTYGELGSHQQALQYQEKALELRKKLFGENHPDTGTSYNNVGSTYKELGSHQQALQYQEKALELRKKLFGENHLDTGTSYNNVGSTYGELGNHQQALQYVEKALEIYQEVLGKQHPNTIILVGNLIITYLNLGDKEKAGKKAAEFYSYIPQNHPSLKWFEEISKSYR